MTRALASLALLALAGPALADPVVLATPGTAFAAGPNGGPQAYLAAFEQWGDGCGTATVTLPHGGLWRTTINAAVKPDAPGPALVEVRVDQAPLAAGGAWSQLVGTRTRTDVVWPAAYLTAGPHQVAVCRMNTGPVMGRGNLLVGAVTLDSDGPSAPPAEPPGTRDPWLQPFSSRSPWNSAIGAGIAWGRASDPDVAQLRANLAGGINAGQWSMPFALAKDNDPPGRIVVTDNTYPVAPIATSFPPGLAPAGPAQGGDHHVILMPADKRTLISAFGCSGPDAGNTLTCGQTQVESVCGMGLGGYGWGAGVVRAHELAAREIRHALRFSLPTGMTRAGDTWTSGLAWPAQRSDYNGPLGLYTGQILYGSFVGISADVDVTRLGLSPGGLVLARALQDYGAYQRDTGGTGGIVFYAEPAAEGSLALAQMRADLPKLIPLLTIGRNLGPLTPQGGGAPRQPPLAGIDRAICPVP